MSQYIACATPIFVMFLGDTSFAMGCHLFPSYPLNTMYRVLSGIRTRFHRVRARFKTRGHTPRSILAYYLSIIFKV
jgi:hypothetical protein